ncbi:MAG: lysophospholipid acyltransferase family protein [Bacteroidota bacterium]
MREDGRRVPALAECVIRMTFQPFSRLMWRPKLVNGGRFAPLEKPCFVYGNHSHNYDPFIFNMFTPWMDSTTGVLTKEYFRNKFMHDALLNVELYPTRKHVPEPHLIRNIYKQINLNRSFLIYPEGGRRWAGQPIPWIDSTAKIFAKFELPVYPIITEGSYISWPRWAKYPRPARMRITLGEPMRFNRKMPIEDVLAKLKAPIDFDETLMPDELKPKWAFRPAVGIHRLLYRDPDTGDNGAIFTPDGTYVENRAGTLRYKMLPDSTLLNEKTGKIVTTATLYNAVKALPLTTNKEGIIVEENVDLYEEPKFPELIPHGKGTLRLYPDRVWFKSDSIDTQIPIEEVLYVGVERNYMLQVFLADKMLQACFKGAGSALQWQDTLLRMKAEREDKQVSASGAK